VERYSAFYRRTFVAAAAIILGYVLLRMIEPFWGALLWAAMLAFLLHPVHLRLKRKLAGRAGLSAGILTGLTPFVIVAPLSLLAVAFAKQVSNLITYLRGRASAPLPAMIPHPEHYPLIGPAVAWARENVPVTAEQVQGWVTDSARTLLQSAAAVSGDLVLGVAGTLLNFFLMLFLLFFLLRDGQEMLGHLMRLVPLDDTRRGVLMRHLSEVLRAVIFGTVMTALIQGTLIGIGFALARLPSPVVFGVLSAAAAFIPAVGTGTVMVPAIIYLAVTGRWGAAAFFTAWGIGVIAAEYLLRPMLAARHAAVSALAVFVGAIGGVATFGLIGILVGPVLLSLVVALLQLAEGAITKQP
jgi:predicted PurR-regulated permease PerM